MAVNYINNEEFLKDILEYHEAQVEARARGLPKPKIPDSIGDGIMKIANNLSRMSRFASYSFKDEMISDAIENCIRYFDNYDPLKSKNPFSYFTQIAYYSFIRKIKKEKKELYIKYKATEELGILDEFELLSGDDGVMKQFEVYSNISEFIQNFENSKKPKKVKKEIGLEKFFK